MRNYENIAIVLIVMTIFAGGLLAFALFVLVG